MTENVTETRAIFNPQLALTHAQLGLANYARAWTQLVHGVVSASVAQMELTRCMCATNAGHLKLGPDMMTSPIDGHEFIHTAQQRYNEMVQGYRQINDGLASSLFTAAETMIDGIGNTPETSIAAAPATGKTAKATTAAESAKASTPSLRVSNEDDGADAKRFSKGA